MAAVPLANRHVGAHLSDRNGGVSPAPWASLNVGVAVGDAPTAVATNRQRFVQSLDQGRVRPVWLRQVHGTEVLALNANTPTDPDAPADAAWTTELNVACIIQVADCLPVLLAARDGRAVAAAHAGWRGLAGGVLENTLQALRHGAGVAPDQLQAWIGPGIGPEHFEVGAEVLLALGLSATASAQDSPFYRYAPRSDGSPRWRLNLPAVAARRLQHAGVLSEHLSVSPHCSFSLPELYFSYRRDGVTGRMAAAIWRREATSGP